MAGKRSQCSITLKDWKKLPILLTVEDVADILGVRSRWVSTHATELGGRKVAARWVFPKAALSELLGIDGD